MRKSGILLSFGLLLIISCVFFGNLVYSDTQANGDQFTETIYIEEAPTTVISEEGSNSEVVSISGVIESLIAQLIEKIHASDDGCWRKPASNRKNTMITKLNVLNGLIPTDAYNKLLRDIKPKLTGFKTDENEETWGNGVFKNPWVICPELREEFRLDCNELLDYIKNPPQPD